MSDAADGVQDVAAPARYGGLVVAGMPMALPIDAVREVLPLAPLRPLPVGGPSVAGALEVRGVSVPVFDLGRACGRTPALETAGCVVVVRHEGRITGLLADRVTGLFDELPGSRVEAQRSAGGGDGLFAFAGSLRRQDDGRLIELLSLARLSASADLPWVDDGDGRALRDADGSAAAAGPADTLIVVRRGGQELCIDALAVYGTLWDPVIEPDPSLASGGCLGCVRHLGRPVPAVDLLEACGLGRRPADAGGQALIVRDEHGSIALLVDEVREMVDLPRDQVVPLPGFGLAGARVFRGVIDGHALTGRDSSRAHAHTRDLLVVDGAALLASPALRSLSTLHAAGDAAAAGRQQAAPAGRPVITFCLPTELAVPMEQVREILPYGTRDAMFGPGNVLRRIQVLDGRSVPVFCLARLRGGTVERVEASAAVLVAEVDGRLVGFGVPALREIERMEAEKRLPPLAGPAGVDVAARTVGTVGSGAARRTIELLDLLALARRVVAQDSAAA